MCEMMPEYYVVADPNVALSSKTRVLKRIIYSLQTLNTETAKSDTNDVDRNFHLGSQLFFWWGAVSLKKITWGD